MPKILLTTPTYPPFNSGLGNSVQFLAAALVRAGCVVVIATAGERRGRRQDVETGAIVEEFNVTGAEFALNPIRGGGVAAYEKFLFDSDFDIIVLNAWQTWSTDICLRWLDAIKGRKFMFSHCVSTNTFYEPQPLRSLLRYFAWRPYWLKVGERMRRLDGLVFLAKTGCDARFDDVRLAKKLGLAFDVIPNSLSPPVAAILDQPMVPYSERCQIISVGAFEWQKGHDFVLRAYAKSAARNRIPLKVFGQKFTPYTETLRKLSHDLGLRDQNVKFYEGISGPSLISEYRRSLLFISGSHTECQPLVLLDAMASGVPFIARATGCIPNLAGGISVLNEAAATQALNSLLNCNDKWHSYVADGQAMARDEHHPACVSDKIVNVLLKGVV